MNWKLLFVFCLTVALLAEVDAASRDRKKKKNRNNDDNEEETTGMMQDEERSAKKDDNKDGGREREREEKEKKEKKEEESSSEEDEEKDKKNGTEVEIPKRLRRQLKKEIELNEERKEKKEKKGKTSESSEECCDDKLKRTQEVNGGEKILLANKPTITARRRRAVVDLPISVHNWMERVRRDTQEHVKPRKGLAANPDNHYNQQQKAHNHEGEQAGDKDKLDKPYPVAHTQARQGLAANAENQKREKRDEEKENEPMTAPTPMSPNNPANPEAGAVFTEIINSPQMRRVG